MILAGVADVSAQSAGMSYVIMSAPAMALAAALAAAAGRAPLGGRSAPLPSASPATRRGPRGAGVASARGLLSARSVRGLLSADRSVPSAVLVALGAEDDRPAADSLAQQLRSRGIACEVAPTAAKFGKQIKHAERRGIPYVWFASTGDDATVRHEVKDIRDGNQVAADPATWQPPSQDLRPQVVAAPTTERETP